MNYTDVRLELQIILHPKSWRLRLEINPFGDCFLCLLLFQLGYKSIRYTSFEGNVYGSEIDEAAGNAIINACTDASPKKFYPVPTEENCKEFIAHYKTEVEFWEQKQKELLTNKPKTNE